MSQMLNTENFPDFVANETINFRRAFDQFPKEASMLYDVENVDIITGKESSIDGFSVAKIKKEGQDFSYANINQGYSKTWNIYEIGNETKITWKLRVGNKYRDIDNRISNLGSSAAKRMEYDKTHRFTFGWSTSYTNLDGEEVDVSIGDSLALFASNHTASASEATTFRNYVANNPVLSKGGIEGAEKLFATQMIDTNGELISEMPTHLVVSNDPNTVNTALEYLRSVAAPDSVNSGVTNVYQGKYKLIILPYLATTAAGAYDATKAKYWMLANLNQPDAICKILQNPTLIPPTMNDGKEFETMDWKFASHAAYAIEILRAQWITGSKGNGAA